MSAMVKPGYKQTEVGVIPEDWQEHRIGELIEFEGGSQPDKSVFRPSWKLGYVRLIQIRDYKTDKYETYVPTNLARRFCTEQDTMIGRYGPPVFQILRGIAGAYNVALIKAKPGPGINDSYAYYFLKQDKLFEFIEKLSQRSSGQTGVDLKELRQYPLPLPPTKAEQEAIAEALSDTDALIESLEQLIAKKRHLKQGAMQELLTGKRRLPGFAPVGAGLKPALRDDADIGGNADIERAGLKPAPTDVPHGWEVKKVKQFGEIVTGSTPPTGIKKYWNGDIPWVTPTDISENKDILETERQLSALGLASIRKLPYNSVLITCIASIGKNVVLRNEGSCNQQINAIIPNKEHDADFLYYLLESKKQYLLGNAGITATMIISKKDFSELDFVVPRQAEQTAIATILSDMDAEIAALETKLAKIRALKQGMMHNLLTGRIRLL